MFSYLFTLDEFLDHCRIISYKTDNGIIRPIIPTCNYNACRDCKDAITTNDECNKICKHMPYLVAWLVDRVLESNWANPGSGIGGLGSKEIHAWCRSVCVYMYRILSEVKKEIPNAGRIAVGLEYYLENDRKGRADLVLAGFGGSKNEKRIIVVELKQYSEINDITDVTGEIKWDVPSKSSKSGYMTVDCPAVQVKKYCEIFEKQISSKNFPDPIMFFPCVYLHNLKPGKMNNTSGFIDGVGSKNEYSDMKVSYNGKGVKYFIGDDPNLTGVCNNYESSFVKYIKDILSEGGQESGKPDPECAKDIIAALRKRTKKLTVDELVDALIFNGAGDNPYEDYLRPDQRDLLNNSSKGLKKQVDIINTSTRAVNIVQGGPGSGKTLIAMLLMNYCMRKEKSVAFTFRANSTRNAYADALIDDICKNCLSSNSKVKKKLSGLQALSFTKQMGALDEVFDELNRNLGDDDVTKHKIYILKNILYWRDIINKRMYFDIIIFDEANRFDGSEDDLKELVKKGKMVVLLGDTLQTIAEKEKVDPITYDYFTNIGYGVNQFSLWSQFRCNQDEGYVSWVETKLGIANASQKANAFDPPSSRPGSALSIENLDFQPAIIEAGNKNDLLNKLTGTPQIILAGPWYDKGALNIRITVGASDESFTTDLVHNKARQGIVSPGNTIYDVYDIYGIEGAETVVIIGKEVTYNKTTRSIEINVNEIHDSAVDGISDPLEKEKIVKNIYRILLTRGLSKCSIYCMDDALREHLKD